MTLFTQNQVAVYVCPHCDTKSSNPVVEDGHIWCRYCDQEWDQVVPTYRAPEYVTIAVYSMSQSYGGPEEGGWYYREYDVIAGTQRSFLAEDAPQADIYFRTLLHRWRNEDNHRYTSQERFAVRVFTEESAPGHEPKHRPHYC